MSGLSIRTYIGQEITITDETQPESVIKIIVTKVNQQIRLVFKADKKYVIKRNSQEIE